MDSLLLASQRPDITLRDLTDMMLFAFNTATPKQLTELYQRYRARGGNSPDLATGALVRGLVWPNCASCLWARE